MDSTKRSKRDRHDDEDHKKSSKKDKEHKSERRHKHDRSRSRSRDQEKENKKSRKDQSRSRSKDKERTEKKSQKNHKQQEEIIEPDSDYSSKYSSNDDNLLDNASVDSKKELKKEGNLDNFPICSATKEILRKNKMEYLFPIQAKTYHQIYEGNDLIGRERTGQGKTMAFALPTIERLRNAGHIGPKVRQSKKPVVVIMVPTRELCIQVGKEIDK